jgi:hypothetical protein
MRMLRFPAFIVFAFILGCITTSIVSGCSKAADRTLTIYQIQSTETYDGQLKVDTSDLPSDAIKSTVDAGGLGDPVRSITLNQSYEFEIVLRLVGSASDAGRLNPNADSN